MVVRLADEAINDLTALRNKTTSLPIGRAVPLVYYRDGKEVKAQVTIGSMPALRLLGMRLRDKPADEGGKPGPIIDLVQYESPAAREALEPGLRVIAVGETPVRTKADADAEAEKLDPGAGVPLTVQYPNGRTMKVLIGGGRAPGGRGR